MSREKENYRNNLELILKDFPSKNLLSVSDVAKWGGRDRRVVKRMYFGDKTFLTPAELANRLS